jgi:sporulation protein YlmC with PRC-barrel domain
MKRLMLSAALLGALSTASLAAPDSTLITDHWLASDVYKASVYDPANKKIGDIDDLVITKDGTISTAVIGVGGFLGVGQKDVGIPFSDLKVASDNNKTWFVLNRTKDDLKNAPAFDKKADTNQ